MAEFSFLVWQHAAMMVSAAGSKHSKIVAEHKEQDPKEPRSYV